MAFCLVATGFFTLSGITQPKADEYTPLDMGTLRGVPESPGPSSRTTPIVITEVMYNPLLRSDGRETEFVEIYNSDETPINIGGFQFTGEFNYTFPTNTVIAPATYMVVAAVPGDVQAVYVITDVKGGFTGRLSNGGGVIRLRNRNGAVLLEINYSNDEPWPLAADNGGHSMVLARPSYGENDPRAWTASDLVGGSPGRRDEVTANPFRTVMINEVLAQTDDPDLDYIELFNYSAEAVDLSGCTLSDRSDTNKFVMPAGTSIPGRGFLVFDQNRLGFSLRASGETLYFRNPSSQRIIDVIRFGPQDKGVAVGRFPDGAAGLSALSAKTPGSPNAKTVARPIVINEIMFNPISGDDDDEFVELFNNSSTAVNIGGWRFVQGIDFTFPTNTTIAANGFLVVARNAARLMSNYANLTAGKVIGDYEGTLANGGERLALTRPVQVVSTSSGVAVTETIRVVVDEVTYHDGGRASRWADGGGSSLELINPSSDNRSTVNWADSDETAKSSWTVVEHTGVLDNGQGAIDELHILLLGAGECLVDDIEVRQASGPNRVVNANFDTNLTGWAIQGNHVQSGLSTSGAGFNGSAGALHLRATSGGDNGANRVEVNLTGAMTQNSTATLRAQARWLRGHPDLLLRVHGNHLEAVGMLPVPKNLGTPGEVNSRFKPNAGPAIQNVKHAPVLPAAGESVVVTAEVNDPDGVGAVVLKYRLDPATNYTTVDMVYRGAGYYSATLPGQASNVLVGFYVEARDEANPAAVSSFPSNPEVNEAFVRFGDPTPPGRFGIYRLWMKQKNITQWSNREKLSNEPLDGTFVYGNERVIYNAGGRFRGSPWLRPSYTTPTGARCAYVWTMPEDDAFLGTDEVNLDSLEPGDRDSTALREVTSYWMAEQMGLPFSNQRYVHVVLNGVRNSSRSIPIYTDSQQPDSAYIKSWFSDDDSGEIFKIDDWFEFNDSVAQEFNVDAQLGVYRTTGGVKKQARYRWSWEKKFNGTLNDDYSNLFKLVDAFNAPSTNYVALMQETIDVNEWLTVFAFRHCLGDWDGYGYNRGKNQFTYKPSHGKWKMLLWDLDFSLGCTGGHPPTQGLFDVNDPAVSKVYTNPHFRRLYFEILNKIANGPFDTNKVVPFLTDKYNAFRSNQVTTVSPFVNSGAQNISIPNWINQRRNYLFTQLRTMTNTAFAITSNAGANYSTDTNSVTLTGTGAIDVHTIKVNGVAQPILWTGPTIWSIRLPLKSTTNPVSVEAFRENGTAIAGAQDGIIITYTGTIDPPVTPSIFINEWMAGNTATLADPADSDFDDWFELYNAGMNTVDLSGFTLTDDAAMPNKWIIPAGTTIAPGKFLFVWADEEGAQNTAGSDLHANFKLGVGGESLTLYATNGTVVDTVTFTQQTNDVSQGRFPDGSSNLYFMLNPTPRAANSISAATGLKISRAALVGNVFEASWASVAGTRYRVLHKTSLSAPAWEVLTEITASGPTATFTDSRSITAARFYRLETAP